MIKLPAKAISGDHAYSEVMMRRPSGGVLSDTLSVIEKTGDQYTAFLNYLTGVCESINAEERAVTDKIQIKQIIRKMPYKSAEYLSVLSASELHGSDKIEGIYKCTRCKHAIVCEETEDSDTTDRLSDLTINQTDETGFRVELKYPFVIRTTEGELEIKDIEFQFPTIENCITANLSADKSKLQFRIYSESMVKVNGGDVDKKDRARYGLAIFNAMDASDIAEIGRQNRSIGIQTTLKKNCPSCGKVFDAIINPVNFFGSALRID